ncbi:nodulation protein NfeD [Candidatus Aerophobetes bacterium]|nr:nodulation protein NfeD [Candidatus Aerophobetes bacterium]
MKKEIEIIILLIILVSFIFCLPAKSENVQVLTINGPISPVTANRLEKALNIAIKEKSECLVIELDTPGGLDTSMRQMTKAMLNSTIPVVVYVSPKGARAASAGVFITLAAHIAAMAPGTNIGAAHPVAMGMQMDEETKEKVLNDASAYIKSIAQKRGKNAQWAEEAVRKSVSITETEALKLGVIDLIAEDLSELLQKIDGKKIEFPKRIVVLKTKKAEICFIPSSFQEKFLQTLADPNIAYILMMIGILGIIMEFLHPGAILPGVVGTTCLILSLFSLQVVPFTLAGIFLIILAVILFLLEIKVTSYGALTIGGVIALILGSLMLIDPSALYISISLKYIILAAALISGFFVFVITYVVKARVKRPVTGPEGMIGREGVAKTNLNPYGKIWIWGEMWNARAEFPEEIIKKGEKVEVRGLEGMRLIVKKKEV